ncbi:hypothetical protein [uncultured Psychromonas sp.]|uniref:hypothetical protein n=1 Tax=uncultured Psychromonas sp. TaxID=173974 RepID=UPI00260B3CD2|nr:hypothetical protein [uncultured Psychromonas sp.]
MLRISNVTENGQSYQNGIEAGDFIYEVNSEEIRSEFHFLAILEKAKSTNQQIKAVIFKDNKARIIYFDVTSPLGVQFTKDGNIEHFKYSLEIDFFDVFTFLIVWLVLLILTLGLASPFFI